MKASEIRELTDAELTARVAELEEERFRLRFRGATEQLEDPLRLRGLRRDVARLKTVLRERALKGGADAQGAGTKATGAAKTAAKGAAKRAATKAAKGTKGTKSAAKKSGGTTKASAAKKAPAKKAATGAGR